MANMFPVMNAAQSLAMLQQQLGSHSAPRGAAGISAANEQLTEAQRAQMVSNNPIARWWQGKLSPEQFDQQLAVSQAATDAAQTSQAQGLANVLQAGGINTRGIPGIGQALGGEYGAEVAEQLMNNPVTNPAVANTLAMQANERQLAAADRARAEQERIGGLRAGLDSIGQDIGAVQDMRTLYDEVGSETLPTAAAGAFKGIRLRLLNSLRQATDSGALQQAEIELFNDILPEGDEWTGLGRAEKMARLNQLEYWFGQRLDNAITASGESFDRAEFDRFGRDYDSILGPVPEGTVEGAGEGSGLLMPENEYGIERQTPTIPGTSIPFASPLGL